MATSKTPGILYSLDAGSSRVVKEGTGHRLFMPAGTRVTWFTDRPEREAGSISLRDLAALWGPSGFVKDPPNAALIVREAAGDRTHVVELTKPRTTKKRVSFRLTESPSQREAGYAHSHDVKAGRYAHARLFIDDAALSPCRAMIYGPSGRSSGPALQQCLLAPGKNLWVYSQGGVSSNPTVVTACAVGGTYNWGTSLVDVTSAGTWQPLASAAMVRGCKTTADYRDEGWMASWGFDAYNAKVPPAGSYCPDPPANSTHVSMTNPNTSSYTMRVTVQQNSNLDCQNYISTIEF